MLKRERGPDAELVSNGDSVKSGKLVIAGKNRELRLQGLPKRGLVASRSATVASFAEGEPGSDVERCWIVMSEQVLSMTRWAPVPWLGTDMMSERRFLHEQSLFVVA